MLPASGSRKPRCSSSPTSLAIDRAARARTACVRSCGCERRATPHAPRRCRTCARDACPPSLPAVGCPHASMLVPPPLDQQPGHVPGAAAGSVSGRGGPRRGRRRGRPRPPRRRVAMGASSVAAPAARPEAVVGAQAAKCAGWGPAARPCTGGSTMRAACRTPNGRPQAIRSPSAACDRATQVARRLFPGCGARQICVGTRRTHACMPPRMHAARRTCMD